MLYSTIPPILVVLSLVGIVIFFVKKAPQIASLSDEDNLDKERREMMAKATFWGGLKFRFKNINWSGVKNIFSFLLGKLTQLFKGISLRLENGSKKFNDSIKNKKEQYASRNVKNDLALSSAAEEDPIIEKINNYEPKKSYLAEMKNVLKRDKKPKEKPAYQEEKIIKPMVSDKVVTPSGRAEMKDRLEDLLIERIAANPRDVEAYERLGEYYMEIDSLSDAKECFKQVLKLDPKNRNVKYRMRILETIAHRY